MPDRFDDRDPHAMRGYGYGGDREDYRPRQEYGWAPEGGAWHERDDRYVAPGDYREWTRQGWGWTHGPDRRPEDHDREPRLRAAHTEPRWRVESHWAHDPRQTPSPDYTGRGPRNYRRSDPRILEDVCDRLTDDPRVDASNIDVRVKDGEVTLAGEVISRGEKRRAEDVAAAVGGVADVINELRVIRT
jgi:hypothetical protein